MSIEELTINTYTILEELRELNDNINHLCILLTGINPSPVSFDEPAVGFVEDSGKVSVCERSSQTSDDSEVSNRESKDVASQVST